MMLPLAAFLNHRSNADGLYSQCRLCHATSRSKHRLKSMIKLWHFLEESKCVDCGEDDPLTLEFDHREGNEHKRSVFTLVMNTGWKSAEAEMAKCDVVCGSCHRKRTRIRADCWMVRFSRGNFTYEK